MDEIKEMTDAYYHSHFEKQCSSCDKPSEYYRFIHLVDNDGNILPVVKGVEFMCNEHRPRDYQDWKHGAPLPS